MQGEGVWGEETGKCRKVAKYKREEQTEPRRQGVKQEASRRATDGLQPDRSDAKEFQAESRQGGKVPGGRGDTRDEKKVGRCLLSNEEQTLEVVSHWFILIFTARKLNKQWTELEFPLHTHAEDLDQNIKYKTLIKLKVLLWITFSRL